MGRKGAIEISFGMIFSIIIIVAIVGVATYAIVYFLDLGKATEMSLFHQKFQETIDDVWSASITDKVVSFTLPAGIELVCFGDLSSNSWDINYEDERRNLIRYASNYDKQNTNRFIYPIEKAGDFAYKKVDKIDLSELGTGTDFECFETRNREIRVRLEKDTFDSLVKVKKE